MQPGDADADERLRRRNDIVGYWLGFWFFALTGIAVAGAIFGFCVGYWPGALIGPIAAAFLGAPVLAVAAILLWAFWLSRYAPIVAAAGGAATGVLATALTWSDDVFWLNYPASLALAGVCGAVTPYFMTRSYRRGRAEFLRAAGGDPDQAWRFSLRDLFFRFTVVTILIALVSCIAIAMR
jgi:hypothetical protein